MTLFKHSCKYPYWRSNVIVSHVFTTSSSRIPESTNSFSEICAFTMILNFLLLLLRILKYTVISASNKAFFFYFVFVCLFFVCFARAVLFTLLLHTSKLTSRLFGFLSRILLSHIIVSVEVVIDTSL